ncbi:phosphatase PAP2 family protein [Aeromicrobium sp.]|uniref:phosphatase PAP2 family protein n=1 Tax=Aeromicrobium sp. TaxID=1871063 RepID=UPI0019A420BF|nr:phosphatase PAP2 family protein [Aeromicrobium sp.]MBC7631723.1 phosphatase PAP2 family protein [Aeromicrobium sp.]
MTVGMTVLARSTRVFVPASLVAAPLGGVVVLADAAREHDGIAAGLDPHVATDVLAARSGGVTHAAQVLTFIGSEVVVGLLALLLVIALLERRGPFHAGLAAAAMSVSAALTVGVKHLVERARPGATDRLGASDSTYSFPSGHTLNSAVLLGLVVVLLLPLVGNRSARIVVTVAAIFLSIGIGASRVYLGYHWASDVVASWFMAIALVTLVRIAAHRWGDSVNTRFAIRRQSGSRL